MEKGGFAAGSISAKVIVHPNTALESLHKRFLFTGYLHLVCRKYFIFNVCTEAGKSQIKQTVHNNEENTHKY